MGFDWKVAIALAALGLSIYNFLVGRRVRVLEKRTVVLNELSEARFLISRLDRIFLDLSGLNFRESPEYVQVFLQIKSQCSDMVSELDEVFERVEEWPQPNLNKLEMVRPQINKVISRSRAAYERANDLKKKVEELIAKRPEKLVE